MIYSRTMELSPKQQAAELLRHSNALLLVSHTDPDGDALGSLLALAAALRKLGKKAVVVNPDQIASTLQFLPGIDQVQTTIPASNETIITIDTAAADIGSLGYRKDEKSQTMQIVLTLQSGELKSENVSVKTPDAKFDAIVVLDCPDLERIGPLYEQNAKFFYDLPVLNIDHHPGNDHFGTVNWVEPTATATAELLVALLESLGGETKLIDEDSATALLAGIIYDTNSFQNANTTPKALTCAAQLVAAGGRREEIIRYFYQTKPLSTLKLWGKILFNLKQEKNYRFVWSYASQREIEEAGAQEAETTGVIDELLKNTAGVDFAALFCERASVFHANLRSIEPSCDVQALAKLFGGGGHEKAAGFEVPIQSTFTETISQTLIKLREAQRQRLELVEKIQS